MEAPIHSLASLFDQLGLDSDEKAINKFISCNSPLADVVELHEAACWSGAQAAFLKQAIEEDSDWSEIVDQLSNMLRSPL